MSAASAVTVVVADDHPVVREGLTALLGSLAGIDVVGTAADGAAAVREAVLHRPDVLVMDVAMPGTDGVTATRQVAAAAPGTAVLMLTMFDDDDSVLAAMQAGARGYLLKGAPQEEIERAIRAVAAGEAIFGPGIARRLLGLVGGTPSQRTPPFPSLTSREREVLTEIARGRSNTAIATHLGLAPKTVGNHISSIFLKLQVASRAEAIVAAREAGLGR
ncbi:MAG: response regulator transcription factor [Sporichthyaceae bacterium]